MSERTHLLDNARPQPVIKADPKPPPKRWRWSVTIEIGEKVEAVYDMHGETLTEVLERASQRGQVIAIVRKKR